MQLTAKLTQLLPIQTGTAKNGLWKKQDIIVETESQFPKKVCISIWGEKINDGQLQIGNTLKIDFEIESREYNNRWYTDLKAVKIERDDISANTAADITLSYSNSIPDMEDDVLPF
jgi:hypothetical protein